MKDPSLNNRAKDGSVTSVDPLTNQFSTVQIHHLAVLGPPLQSVLPL